MRVKGLEDELVVSPAYAVAARRPRPSRQARLDRSAGNGAALNGTDVCLSYHDLTSRFEWHWGERAALPGCRHRSPGVSSFVDENVMPPRACHTAIVPSRWPRP
jgi:hypothetical protein